VILRLPVRFESLHGDVVVYTLFDSGASFSCIHPRFLDVLGAATKMPMAMEVATASDREYIKIDERIMLDFIIHGYRLADDFMVVPGLTEEAIIGAPTLQKWRIKLDFETDEVVINPRAAERRLQNRFEI